MKTLGEALPDQIKRCQELIIEYDRIGPTGAFGKMMIQRAIYAAIKAMAEGNLVAMIAAYKELEGCQ